MKNSLLNLLFIFGLLLSISSCESDDNEPLKAEKGEELLGGEATIFDQSPNAFIYQIPGLSDNDGLLFFVGNSFFNQNWVSSPASTKARDGLGPVFNARSCAGCHFKDGRGRPPAFDGETATGMLLRLSVDGQGSHGEPVPEPTYGGQFQDNSILGVMKEGGFEILYSEVEGKYPDGTSYSLRKPHYQFVNLEYGEMSSAVKISPRVAPQMIGLGLLEAISEETILRNADEDDVDNDGISGRPNYVWDVLNKKTTLGRFGWKANEPNILQQSAGAFSGDMGITTFVFPDENCPHGVNCDTLPNGGKPEIDDDDLLKVVLYSSTLAVPAQRDVNDPNVLKGRQLFEKTGCVKCHIPKVQTGIHPTIDGLSNQTIRPYTDLLLHDMGEDLADFRPDFQANGKEWRTPPLWGIGLFNVVNGHTFYLHDGRARNIEEAILWHGGEAENIKKKFMELSKDERSKLIRFLESL